MLFNCYKTLFFIQAFIYSLQLKLGSLNYEVPNCSCNVQSKIAWEPVVRNKTSSNRKCHLRAHRLTTVYIMSIVRLTDTIIDSCPTVYKLFVNREVTHFLPTVSD